jgi:hypothetical protein
MLCRPRQGCSEESYYLSEWSQAERAEGLHIPALAFAFETKSERGRAAQGDAAAGRPASCGLLCCVGGAADAAAPSAPSQTQSQQQQQQQRQQQQRWRWPAWLERTAAARLLRGSGGSASVAPDGSHRSGSTAANSGAAAASGSRTASPGVSLELTPAQQRDWQRRRQSQP